MYFSNCFQLSLILFLISALQLIESQPKDLTRLPSLCYEESERLVRTPYGFRCVVTRRSNEKRSTAESELFPPEIDLTDIKSNDNYEENLNKEEDLNSVVPIVEPMALSAKYRKIVIKNNRGPWKIANMIFKRSPKSDTAHVVNDEQPFADSKDSKKDGLLVSKHFSNDKNIDSLSQKSKKNGTKTKETAVPLLTESSVEEKFIRNLPKINLFTKTVDKKNLRNFKFSSDIDVIDLMEEDSVLRSHSFDQNNTFVVNVLSADKRKTRSPDFNDKTSEESADQLRSDDKNGSTFTPIRIFVFLNRNRNKERDSRTDTRTDSSENTFNIAPRPQPRKGTFGLKSHYAIRTSTTTTTTPTPTTTTTTTTTTTPSTTTTTTSIPIKRILKKLDLNEFEDRISSEQLNADNIDEEVEEDKYVEPTEASIGELFSLTSAPISRNWNFICGKRRGFFADIENDCRTYYQCSVRGRQRWECPPGTRFNQFSSTCDWLENVDCLSFKDLIDNKSGVAQNIDITPSTTPLPSSESTSMTPSYEPDYEDAFEE